MNIDQSDNLPIVIYTPESQMRSPVALIKAMITDISASRELAWRLFIRDISAQYRQSLFGIIWAFAPPIITSLIFIGLQSQKIVNFGETEIPYPVFVLIGTILWQIFTESLNAPLKSVTLAKSLLVKVNFPREALIISAFLNVLFNLLIKLLIIAVIFAVFRLQFSIGVLYSLILILFIVLFGMAVGLLITPIGMLYTDVATSLPIITQLLFFITPVAYQPPTVFPLSVLAFINPVSPLITGARDLLTQGSLTNMVPVTIVASITIALLIMGWTIYRVALPIIIERISA